MKANIIHSIAIILAAPAAFSCGAENGYDAQGTFEAKEITLSAESNGRILSFDIVEGDTVEAEKTLLLIDTIQLHLQKMQLIKQGASVLKNKPDVEKQSASLKAQLAKALKERERVRSLLEENAATQKQLEDAEALVSVLETNIEATRQSLSNNASAIEENASMIEIQIAQIEDMLKKCRVSSPIRGTVIAKYAEAGEFASIGRPLVKIADMQHLFLRAYFSSAQVSELKIGQEVMVKADFGADKEFLYTGKITWISSESEFTPKTIQTKDSRANLVYAVKIAVENDGRLKLGFSGEVIL